MKKLLLALILIIASQSALKASHVLGGEIRWECLSNGRFVFFAKVFRDCTGIPYPFDNKTLEIVGNPLPRSSTNAPISSILLRPDSNTWQNNRFGDTSPQCAPGGDVITCADEDEGAIQQFFFQSDPIQLRGTPPSGGWKFYLVQPCCRPNVTNLAIGGTMMLRAIMYPDADNNTVDVCKDSSPEFLALPTNMICRGYEFTYNHTAIDKDLDSLVYDWDRTYNTPTVAPQAVPYANGFNFNNPTPDRTFNTQNIPATLDPITGKISVGVWSGIGAKDYLTVVRVDAYRGGRVIASVFREIPFVFFDCPRLPNTQINQPPEIFIDGDSAEGLIVDIVAGQQVRIPFQATDLDFPGGIPGLQKVTVEPAGFMFSRDLQDPQFCLYPPPPGEQASCAYLRNQDPTFNGTVEPPRFQVAGFAGIATEFVWDTKCHHIATVGTGVPGQNEGIYNFVMRTYDDHCPIPGINYPTITVKVRDPIPLQQPIMKGLSVNLDGTVSHQWIPPMDSATNFWKYKVETSTPGNNFNPTQFLSLDTNERRYAQERRTTAFRIYRPLASNPNLPDMMNPVDDKDFYLRMRTVSGCTRDVPSIWNQPARVIEVNTTPSGDAGEPARSEATMNWNAPTRPNHFYHPYYQYVSQTKYYVWTNDNITADPANPGTYSGLDNPNNWLLRGDTYNRNYEVSSTTCSGWVAFRVEARDTIITYKQGTAPRQDTLDTLYFSTFSVIDTMFMKNPGAIPSPRFDTVEVRDNGDLFVRVDAGNAGTTGEYEIYFNAIDPNNLQGTITKPDDSLLITGANGQAGPIDVIMRAIDDCDTNNTANSNVYETFIPSGQAPTGCDDQYTLSWIDPSGFPNGTRGYRVYRKLRRPGEPAFSQWELIETLGGANNTSTTTTVISETSYQYKVVAYDDEQAVIISGILQYDVPLKRTFEIVPAPELRCAYVEDNGNVTLSFLPADPSRGPEFDSTDNWVSYRFQYRVNGGAWQNANGSAAVQQDTNSFTVTGIDAIENSIQFRATSISGCDGITPAPYNEINLIEPIATAEPNDADKRVRVEWTGSGIVSNEPDRIGKSFGLNNYYGGGEIARINDNLADSYIDNSNSAFCDTIAYYYIVKEDQLSGCFNRSRPDSARIRDVVPPPPQKLDYLSYETYETPFTDQTYNSRIYEANGELVLSWSPPKPSSDVTRLMIFSPDANTAQNDSINTVKWEKRTDTIPRSTYNADDTSYVISAQSIDTCGRRALNFEDFDYHESININAEFNPCDSAMELSWNKYDTFQVAGTIEYVVELMRFEIFAVDQSPNPPDTLAGLYDVQEIGTTTDTTFTHPIEEDGRRYVYRVYARPEGSNGLRAYSNWDSLTAKFGALPQYNYLAYATVLPTKEVEIQLYKDSSIEVGGYALYRAEGVDSAGLTPIGRIAPENDTSLITTEDNTAFTDDLSYLYQIVVENVCGNAIDTTNVGTTIHLRVKPDNEALTNTLSWNEYQGWDSAVAFYNIYRGYNGDPADELYASVPATDEPGNQFVDDVYDNAYSIGNYCYRVEAVQGNLSPEYANDIKPATSASNEVCVVQEPLFYVPNAFSPTGVNKVFGPTGQFFDFTLFEMTIFNRWGELIYETRDIAKGWDGTVNGEPAPLGSYVYAIRFVDANGEEHRRKGTVTLIK